MSKSKKVTVLPYFETTSTTIYMAEQTISYSCVGNYGN